MNHLEFAPEQLEHRTMLAGDVGLDISGGDLVIRGDNEANDIQIRLVNSSEGTMVHVTGKMGTTINGDAFVHVAHSDITDDVRINLRGGENRLVMADIALPAGGSLAIPDDLNIRTGSGNDRILLGDVNVSGDISIRTGGGTDQVFTGGTSVNGDYRINTGSSRDFIRADSVHVRRARWNTGGGDDVVGLVNGAYAELRVSMSGGGDTLLSHEVYAESARLSGGGSDDIWLDCNNDPAPSNLFAIADFSSMEASEVSTDDVFDLLNELQAEFEN